MLVLPYLVFIIVYMFVTCTQIVYVVKYYSIGDLYTIRNLTCSISAGCITKFGFLEQNKDDDE
jgi:hypothetical protein